MTENKGLVLDGLPFIDRSESDEKEREGKKIFLPTGNTSLVQIPMISMISQ